MTEEVIEYHRTPERWVICADAYQYIKASDGGFKAVICGVPGLAETGLEWEDWQEWANFHISAICEKMDPNGVFMVYCTDRRKNGRLLDRQHVLSAYAQASGLRPIFHKIILRRDPGKSDLFRPAYSNLIAFSKNITAGSPTPDVIHAGRMEYKNAIGANASRFAMEFFGRKTDTETVLNPYCGSGSVLKIANEYGFRAIGIDNDREQCEYAKNL